MSSCGGNSRYLIELSSRSSHDLSSLAKIANSVFVALSKGFRSDSGSGLSVGCVPTRLHFVTVEVVVSKKGVDSMYLVQQIQRLQGILIQCSESESASSD